MSYQDLVQTLVSYLPPAVVRAVHANPVIEPRAERFAAAVLLADISGFTALTEKLAARGPSGAEELTLLLNHYFSRMIGLLEAAGGEVVQFSGDALIAVFPVQADEERRDSSTTPASTGSMQLPAGDVPPDNLQSSISVRRAFQAATRMQQAMDEFATLTTSAGSVALGMKIAIGFGEVLALSVGGILGRWQYIIAGDPLRQVAEAEHQAMRGAIVLSPEAHSLLTPTPVAPRPYQPIEWAEITPAIIAALRTHIPGAITYRLEAGQADWLAEMRRMNILFLGLGGLSYDSPNALDQIQAMMAAFQQTVYRYEGSINKLLVDDKGAISIVLFGAPPMAHIDDPLRAVRCALDLQQVAADLDLRLAIGITTGQVFAGPVGSPTRREYTVMGDAVNLAARLMQLAGRGGILSDYATFHATTAEVQWEILTPQTVKGKVAAVRIYRPLALHHTRPRPVASQALIGRVAEMAAIEQILDESIAGSLRVLCIEGESGIGKTRLVIELIQRMRDRGLVGLLGSGQAIEQHVPYRAWRELFGSYFDLDTLPDTVSAAHREQVLARIAEIAPHLIERAPLLNDVLGLGIPDTSLTASLQPKLRQASLTTLLIELLSLWTRENALVLILEDAHWLDSLSWQLAIQVARGLADQRLLMVLALQPLDPPANDHPYQQIRALASATRLALGPLSAEEAVSLAAARLEVTTLPPALAALIEQTASGNPFVVEELALSLRESGAVSIADGRCELTIEPGDLQIPETVQGLVLSRIDRLPAREQLTIKVAAVIGRIFGRATLRDVHPARLADAQLDDHLANLATSGMVLPLAGASLLRSHTFKQIITQEVTYSTLLQAHRRELHERVARWYESYADESQAELYPYLAYHWQRAGNHERELHYSTLAAKRFAAEYANAEALSYLGRALQLTSDPARIYELRMLRVEILERTGDRQAQRAELEQLQVSVDAHGSAAQQAKVANFWAAFYRDVSDYPAAIAAVHRSQAAAAAAGDVAARARGLTILGQVMEYQGVFQEARGYFEQSLAIYRQIGYRRGEANNLSSLSNVYRYTGNYATARDYALQALEIRRAIGDRASEATSLNNLAIILLQLGEAAAAREHRQRALEIVRAIGDRSGEALSLGIIGDAYLVQGDYGAARSYLEQALRLFESLGERRREANCLNQIGQVWRDVGDYHSARRCFERALATQREIGDHSFAAYSAINLAFVQARHDLAAAQSHYREGIALAIATGNRDAEAYGLSYRALTIHEPQQAWDAAAADYRAALQIRAELRAAPAAIEDQAGLGRVALASGRIAEARSYAEACLSYLDQHGVDGIEFPVLVYLSCYDILRAGGDDAALRVLRLAYGLLRQRADAVSDEVLRTSLLYNVPANRRLLVEGETRLGPALA